MTRAITTHAINPCNQAIRVTALDNPGPGGASHRYSITWEKPHGFLEGEVVQHGFAFEFQNGPVKDASGVNGITHEALLAVLIDRLQGFQDGTYACPENDRALLLAQGCLAALNSRTTRREAAGIEGTMAKDPVQELDAVVLDTVVAQRQRLTQRVAELATEHGVLLAEKDGAYHERDQLVAALSKLFPASIEQHTGTGPWDIAWMNVIIIDLPTGQVSWHIHERELPLFAHLPRGQRTWDGHDTAEKYRRLGALAHVAGNLATGIDWMTVRAILTTSHVINEAKGESRHTDHLDFEDLDGFVHGLITEAEKLIKAGRIEVRA